MGAPRFFVGMFGTLSFVSVAMYAWTGSLLSTFLDVVLAAIFLQLGYVLGVVFLIVRRRLPAPRS